MADSLWLLFSMRLAPGQEPVGLWVVPAFGLFWGAG